VSLCLILVSIETLSRASPSARIYRRFHLDRLFSRAIDTVPAHDLILSGFRTLARCQVHERNPLHNSNERTRLPVRLRLWHNPLARRTVYRNEIRCNG